MNNTKNFITKAILLCLSAYAILTASAFAQENRVVSPNEKTAGLSQADWSAAWWQWAGAFDRSESPVADQTGEKCQLKQTGSVWFLAGTYGSQRTIRTCTVPQDKYLFFPLINYVVMPHDDKRCKSCCESFKDTAASMTDGASMLILEIDGVRIKNLADHRQATKECFNMGARTDEKYDVYPSAANGYYVMLRPLPPGKHTLNFGGVLPDGSAQAITYTLIVK